MTFFIYFQEFIKNKFWKQKKIFSIEIKKERTFYFSFELPVRPRKHAPWDHLSPFFTQIWRRELAKKASRQNLHKWTPPLPGFMESPFSKYLSHDAFAANITGKRSLGLM